VLTLDQVEQQRGRGGVGEHGPRRADLGAVGEHHALGAGLADDDPRDPAGDLHAPAVALEDADQRGGDRPGPALGDAVARGRRRHAEHVADRGPERVARPEVDVQRERREHPPRRLTLKQSSTEPRAARQHDPREAEDRERQHVQQREDRRKRSEQEPEDVLLHPSVPQRQIFKNFAVARVAERLRDSSRSRAMHATLPSGAGWQLSIGMLCSVSSFSS
jgi:hypothetical protein